MKLVSLFWLLVTIIMLATASYGVVVLLLSFAYALAAALYWLITMAISLFGVAILMGAAIMIGYWIYPEHIEPTYIPYGEDEEPA